MPLFNVISAFVLQVSELSSVIVPFDIVVSLFIFVLTAAAISPPVKLRVSFDVKFPLVIFPLNVTLPFVVVDS